MAWKYVVDAESMPFSSPTPCADGPNFDSDQFFCAIFRRRCVITKNTTKIKTKENKAHRSILNRIQQSTFMTYANKI